MNQVPTVGRIVHYVSYGTPNGEYESECRAAVVTRVYTRDIVDLCVLNPEGMFFNHTVKRSDSISEGGTWHWPERV